MTPTNVFGLGPASWSRNRRLLRDGRPTIPGVCLLHAFVLPDGRALLITDHDCPWEEETEVVLVDADGRRSGWSHFGLPFCFFSLERATPVGAASLELAFDRREGAWRIDVLDGPEGWLRSCLRVTWVEACDHPVAEAPEQDAVPS